MENNCKRIIIKSGLEKTLVFDDNFSYDSLLITIQKDAKLHLRIAFLNKAKNLQIKAILKDNAIFDGAFADFSNSNIKLISTVRLDGEYASAKWNLSCLSKLEENKTFDISFLHMSKHSESLLNNYGVGMGNSHLTFKGVSHIENGAHGSAARQIAKIIVFDDGVVASSSPSLRIDENDVIASHAAVVGRLNEDHVFYLKSRGLNEEQARRLITFGYLSPIASFFDEETKNQIIHKIESRF